MACIHYDRAVAAIKAHGHEAYVTPEGVLGIMWERRDGWNADMGDGDCWQEVPEVFPVSDDNTIDRAALAAWLGY